MGFLENTKEHRQETIDLDYQIEILTRHGSFGTYRLDEYSADLLKEFFAVLDELKPLTDGITKEKLYTFWFSSPAPTAEEYFDALHDEDSTREDMEAEWKDLYPHDTCWYKLDAATHTNRDGEKFYGVFLNNNYILSIGDSNEDENETVDAGMLIQYLIRKTKEVIEMVREGTYNETIESTLPYRYRSGIIDRKTYYSLFPSERDRIRNGLTDQEIKEFCDLVEHDSIPDHELIPQMTARTFFEACACGYLGCGYKERKHYLFHDTEEEHQKYGGITPRERYSMYADGRDDGLRQIPMDDPKAFSLWERRKEPYYKFSGSHPYEVRTSFSIAHSIHLYPWKKDFRNENSGWYFFVSCKEPGNTEEVVRWALSLSRAGFPVRVFEASAIAARLQETDEIGVEPAASVAIYETNCGPYFGKEIHDVTVMEREAYDNPEITGKIRWLPEEKVEIRDDEGGGEN